MSHPRPDSTLPWPLVLLGNVVVAGHLLAVLSVALLTNRTWPDCSNQAIKLARPKFHDAVVEALRDR